MRKAISLMVSIIQLVLLLSTGSMYAQSLTPEMVLSSDAGSSITEVLGAEYTAQLAMLSDQAPLAAPLAAPKKSPSDNGNSSQHTVCAYQTNRTLQVTSVSVDDGEYIPADFRASMDVQIALRQLLSTVDPPCASDGRSRTLCPLARSDTAPAGFSLLLNYSALVTALVSRVFL